MISESPDSLFTVIVPTHNRAGLIVDALNTAQAQTHRPIEIIVVDDGSTDDTRKVVSEWAEQNQEAGALHVRYLFQDNAGPAAARNRGIEEIHGEYVQFLDSDDHLYPSRLEKLVKTFEETGADFIQTGFESLDAETGEVIRRHFARADEDQLELALKGLLWANTLRSAFRSSLVKHIGPWDEGMSCFEDREYVERAVAHAEKAVAIREILASARRGGSQRVSDRLRTYEGRKCRILCERRLAEAIRGRDGVSSSARQAFASRLYGLGFRSNASGWPDLGKECGQIADSLGADLDAKGKIRRMVWRSGRVPGSAYLIMGKIKRLLRSFGTSGQGA